MSEKEIDKKKIESLLPHREPMLLIDKLTKIVPLKSATAIMNVKKDGFLRSRTLSRTTCHAWGFNSRSFWSSKNGSLQLMGLILRSTQINLFI